MKNNKQQLTVLGAILATGWMACGQQAAAHTTIADNVLMEGERVYTAATVPHGCDGMAVRSQAMLFPTGKDPLAVDNNGNAVNLADHLVGALTGGVPMGPRFLQDKNAFRTTTLINDADGVVVGAVYDNGYLQPDLTAWVPFRMSAPSFAAASCADTLTIRIPVLNGCNKSATSTDRVDAWVGRLTDKYNDSTVMSLNFWPTVTVERDLDNNPLPEDCGESIQLEVSPSDESIDTYLGIPGYWPNN